MTLSTYNFHERTLVGAIDSYMKGLVHVRPFVADQHEELLEALAARWFANGGANTIEAIKSEWLTIYLASHGQMQTALDILQSFYGWAIESQLIEKSPLESITIS